MNSIRIRSIFCI